MRVTRFKLIYILFVMVMSIQLILPAAAKAEEQRKWGKNDQEAIICYKDGIEQLIVRPQLVEQKDDPRGWIVAVPTEPTEISEVPSDVFSLLSDVIPRPNYETRYNGFFATQLKAVGTSIKNLFKRKLNSKKGRDTNQEKAVEVVKQVGMGDWTTVVLKATNADELNGWLKENGFMTVNPQNDVFMEKYIEKGWVFVVSKSASEPSTSVLLTFPAKAPIYPTQLNRSYESSYFLILNVIADKAPKSKIIPLQYSYKLTCNAEEGIHFQNTTIKNPTLENLMWNGCSISRMAKMFYTDAVPKSEITLKMVSPFQKLTYDPYDLSTTQKTVWYITLPVRVTFGVVVFLPIMSFEVLLVKMGLINPC